jgi:hypothetical protein
MSDKIEMEEIIDNLYSKYLLNLISYMKNNNIDYNWIEKQLQKPDTEMVTETSSDSKMILSTDNLYNKPWTKLNLIHKKIKIKEYVNNLNFINTDEKSSLINSLVLLLESKVLTKKNTVEYNESDGKIISIYQLKYENNKYIINQ